MPRRPLVCVSALIICASALHAQDAGEQLIAAAQKGDIASAKKLIENGADVNVKGLYDQTPIFFAADRGQTDVVRLLLDKGANINHKDSFYKMTALSRAAMKGQIEVIRLLLARGAEGAGEIARQAVDSNKSDMLKIALDSGKMTAKDLTTALSMAERTKKPQMAEALRSAGAQPLPPANFKVDEATLGTYQGVYVGGRGGTTEIEIVLENGTLKAKAGTAAFTLGATSATEFRETEGETVSVEFRVREGKATDLLINPGAQEFVRKGVSK